MQILVTGGTGFIGRKLVEQLIARGDVPIVLSRNSKKAARVLPPSVRLIGSLSEIDSQEQIQAIINLAGAPIIGALWTARRRATLTQSRVKITQQVQALICRLETRPAVLVSGSAIGYYGINTEHDYAEDKTEDQGAGTVFQAQMCEQWEQAALAASKSDVRVCILRTGVVLGGNGGALPQFALPVRLGLGSVMGSGKQWISWIHLQDMLGLILFALDNPEVQGAINATAPNPVTHRTFMEEIAGVLHRPLWFRIPEFVLRLLLGEMAQLFVDGQRVVPAKALALGYQFQFPELHAALTDTL